MFAVTRMFGVDCVHSAHCAMGASMFWAPDEQREARVDAADGSVSSYVHEHQTIVTGSRTTCYKNINGAQQIRVYVERTRDTRCTAHEGDAEIRVNTHERERRFCRSRVLASVPGCSNASFWL